MTDASTAVRDVLARFPDPETGRNVIQMDQVRDVRIEGQRLRVELGLTSWAAPIRQQTAADLEAMLRKEFPSLAVDVATVDHPRPAETMGQTGLTAKTVLAIGSGKGGVGKSSIAVFLAYGLARAGCKVGLLDADLYGPSIPHLLGTDQRPGMVNEQIEPIQVAGMKMMSIGLLVPPGEAVIWRGPMLHGAMAQFLRDTAWGDLDYLVIDMPPGTGDVALSLAQLLPLAGAVVVSTPQDVALLDATKAVAMFRKMNIDVLGLVENMSFFVCPHCGAREDIFGSGGAKQRAAQWGVPLLGEVPLDTQLRILADQGRAVEAFEHPAARDYLEAICRNLVSNLAAARRRKPPMPELPVLG